MGNPPDSKSGASTIPPPAQIPVSEDANRILTGPPDDL